MYNLLHGTDIQLNELREVLTGYHWIDNPAYMHDISNSLELVTVAKFWLANPSLDDLLC